MIPNNKVYVVSAKKDKKKGKIGSETIFRIITYKGKFGGQVLYYYILQLKGPNRREEKGDGFIFRFTENHKR
jgi:hypothetical protein